MNLRSVAARAALLSSLVACGGAERGSNGRVEDSAAGTVALGLGLPRDYQVASVASAGAIRGVVQGDTAATPVASTRTCADSVAAGGTTGVSGRGTLHGALVWVDGIHRGKPLPELRRERVTIEHCQIAPRVLAVTVGSTVNVFSADPVVHETRFYRENRGEPVAHLMTVDEGQVIPSERIAAEPGIVEARCAHHPWVRGYVAVFEHPYFAITDERGTFAIDSLPPGTYTVKIWHESLPAALERRVVIGAGGMGRLDVQVGGGSPAAGKPTEATAAPAGG